MAVLWSEFLALWFDRTRRRALPLLLATLLLLIPSLPASADCSCEVGEGPHAAHQHDQSEAQEHHHDDDEGYSHGAQSHASVLAQSAGHAHVVGWSQVVAPRTETVCCSCSRAPIGAAVVTLAAPTSSSTNADTQALVYVRALIVPPFALDALTGLFGRAGPSEGKPQLVFLASLTGRAPPVSL